MVLSFPFFRHRGPAPPPPPSFLGEPYHKTFREKMKETPSPPARSQSTGENQK
jgi:hypothetical protein